MNKPKPAGARGGRGSSPAFKHPGNVFVPIVRRAKQSIVSIRTRGRQSNRQRLLEEWLSPLYPERDSTESLGTGFIIHPDGYILTSEHVIEDAGDIQVKLNNGEKLRAKVVWTDPVRDIGILKIESGRPLKPLPIGSSADSQVGEMVISIGNPLGLDQTITTGVISAKNRHIAISNADKVYEDVIQTDCAINPGNSGGPLINLRGRVIGMNAFVIKNNQGLGFAIGIDSIFKRIRSLIP